MKPIGAFFVVLAVLVLGGFGLYYGGIFGNNVQANYQKRVVTAQVQQAVRTAPFAQSVYEQFFTDCNAYVARGQQVAAAVLRLNDAKAQVASATDSLSQSQAVQAEGQARADLTGLEQSEFDIAARYAAASQEYTRGQFKDASLPPVLTPNVTTCQ